MIRYLKGRLKQNLHLIQYIRNEENQHVPQVLNVGFRRGYVWTFALLCCFGVLLGFDLIGEALQDLLVLLFEFVEETLEHMYRKYFYLNIRHAQMATAYTGFIIIAGAGYVLFRKFSAVLSEMYTVWKIEQEKIIKFWIMLKQTTGFWWASQDAFNKCFAAIAGAVLALPFVYLVCIAIGNVIADLV